MNIKDMPHTIILSVAKLNLMLDTAALPQPTLARLLCEYAPFLAADSQATRPGAAPDLAPDLAADLAVDLLVEDGPRFVEPAPGQSWSIEMRHADGRLLYTSYYEQGWIDLAKGRGRLVLRPQAQPENFLRVAFARLALAHDGLLLHAGGLIRNGCGYVFFGHSGAGKSTVAALAPQGSTLLSDDLVLLRLHKEPSGPAPEQVWLHSVPFCGEALPAPRPMPQLHWPGFTRCARRPPMRWRACPPRWLPRACWPARLLSMATQRPAARPWQSAHGSPRQCPHTRWRLPAIPVFGHYSWARRASK